MNKLRFGFSSNKIPLGAPVDLVMSVEYDGNEALDDLWGRLVCSPNIKIVGDESFHVHMLKPGQKKDIPLQVKGVGVGNAIIEFSDLNSTTAGGVPLPFNPIRIQISVNDLKFNPDDVSLILKSKKNILQNSISLIECKVHNNGYFPVEIATFEVTINNGDVFTNQLPALPQFIQPGQNSSFNFQILSHLAGEIPINIRERLNILGRSFERRDSPTITVSPSEYFRPNDEDKKIRKILVITSDPIDQKLIRADNELKNILFIMKQSARLRDDFQIEVLPAATTEEIKRDIIVWHPYILHFAGHGVEDGIIIENKDKKWELFSTQAIVSLLKPLSNDIECVILNACKSRFTAEKIAENIHYVIGMTQNISDPAAVEFSKGFYEALGSGFSIENSFELGRAYLKNKNLRESEIPELFKKSKV